MWGTSHATPNINDPRRTGELLEDHVEHGNRLLRDLIGAEPSEAEIGSTGFVTGTGVRRGMRDLVLTA